MTTWILILTLTAVGTDTTAMAVDHIPGFATERDCSDAGKQWSSKIDHASLASPVCVPQPQQAVTR